MQAALGKGGAAQIYRVLDAATSKQLALKQLHSDASPKLREMFEREYQTLASFDHPHTVRVFEFGHDPSGLFYTMELLEGEDLGGCGALPWRSACRYLADVASALSLLHARGLIHRDVSPRNLWRMPDDRVKLIDFGALARFGVPGTVVGTPPCIPPEALERRALDQRADLYGLGAVAYYMLTGRHAYPARELSELQSCWSSTPTLPSSAVPRQEGAQRSPIPPELDALVLSLLQHDPLARPASAAEVLDRLHSLLGQAHDTDAEAALARLRNTGFVGRVPELRALHRQLDLAMSAHGQVSVVEGPSGVGTSRILAELAQRARVLDAAVIEVDAGREPGSYGLASALMLALLDALPERAQEAVSARRSVLAHLPRLRERLAAEPAHFPPVAGELRVHLQRALSEVLRSVASELPVVVLVDGLAQADEESAAFLHRLALDCRDVRLLVVCGLLRSAEPRAIERALLKVAEQVSLGPLNDLEHKALLQSVFGSAEHLPRLAARLFRVTRGNPGHTIELCRQLVQRGTISFVNGTWVLPLELSDAALQDCWEQAQSIGPADLSGGARALLRVLSVHEGPLSHELIERLAGPELARHVPELLAREVLLPARAHLVFAHPALRTVYVRELDPETEQRVRRSIADYTLASPSASNVERAEAGLQLLRCGDARGAAVLVAAAKSCVLTEVDRLLSLAPCFEAGLQLFRASGRPQAEQVVLLAALARAGYEADPRYSVEYGEQAIAALEALLGWSRVRRWRRFLGLRVSFYCSLLCTVFELLRQRNNPCIPGLSHCIQLLVVSVFATTATRLTFFDPDGAERCAQALEPLTALGANSAPAFMYDFMLVMAETGRDPSSRVIERWQRILARLGSKRPLLGAPPELITVSRGGALYAMGSLASHRDDAGVLRTAEALDGNGYALNQAYAAQLRAVYYGFHGMLAEYARCRERVEQLAIQHGTSWQTEVWIPGPESALALLLHDAMGMKRAAEQMKRLSQTAPSLRVHARHMHGVYLLLRGRSAEALPWLSDCLHETPCSRPAWGRSHGVLARAYNQLGDHEKARDACLRALEHLNDGHLDFPAINMVIVTELAIAEAQLGDLGGARARVERLFQRFGEHRNPLTLGHLHETLVEIALGSRDLPEARAQFASMKALYQSVGSSSLMQRCDLLLAAIGALAGDAPLHATQDHSVGDTTTGPVSSHVTLLADQLLASKGRPFEERAPAVLRALAASVGATHGVLAMVDEQPRVRVTNTLDGRPASPGLERWMAQRLDNELSDPDTIVSSDGDHEGVPELLTLHEGNLVYRLTLLSQASEHGTRLVGVAALGGEYVMPRACPAELARLACELLL